MFFLYVVSIHSRAGKGFCTIFCSWPYRLTTYVFPLPQFCFLLSADLLLRAGLFALRCLSLSAFWLFLPYHLPSLQHLSYYPSWGLPHLHFPGMLWWIKHVLCHSPALCWQMACCRPDWARFYIYIRSLGKLPEKCYLATLDVSSLYTNIDTDEGLTIVEEELGKTNQNKPSPMTLSCLLEKVLKLNNFTFGNEHYIQIKGTAMGTRVAPNFANVYMGRLEERSCTKQSGWTISYSGYAL